MADIVKRSKPLSVHKKNWFQCSKLVKFFFVSIQKWRDHKKFRRTSKSLKKFGFSFSKNFGNSRVRPKQTRRPIGRSVGGLRRLLGKRAFNHFSFGWRAAASWWPPSGLWSWGPALEALPNSSVKDWRKTVADVGYLLFKSRAYRRRRRRYRR